LSRQKKNHSSPSGAEAMNQWSYIATPYVCFLGVDKMVLPSPVFLPHMRDEGSQP